MRMPNVGETSEVTSPNPGVLYYGVYVPNDTNLGEDNDKVHVYTDKSEALKLVKKYKKARFKAFRLKEEAEEFAEHGSESCGTTASTPERSGPVAEKPSPFKAPKPQDLVQLRKAIETGATDIVKKIVLENPRYLISIGDTPAILQEGSRYNALHIAAKARRDDICEFILDTVGDPAFISRLYGDDDMISCQSRANILLDLYLNMPDKGLNETPLHFASKFGATAVVAKLVSYSECDKHPKNKFSQTPKDMICSRAPSSNATDVKTIRNLLEEQFYVPVLRSEDNSLPPTVGEPFSPSRPPALVQHVVNPTVDIHAYAGPMPQEEAKIFRKKWKTPPRSVSSSAGTPTKNDSPLALSTTVRLMDTEKGLERIGRTLAHETKVGWKEYWPFLGTFTDFATKEGLDLLEAYMKKRFQETWGDDNFEKHCEHKELAGGGSGDVDNDGNPSDDDKFFTPPGSPHDSIEEFADVSDGENVFIEGNTPGKVDLDVLHALAGVDILQQKYPNIYRWRHAILLYPEKERELWASPAFTRHLKKLQTPGTLTPTHRHEDGFLSSPDAWHRRLVRCTHAPRAVDFSNVT
ncbi:ankyrin repeat and LEM domain-containing protein 2 isoform X2 [Schistocerca piceifrons]|uniref:ankyrin repeat and LEM domain-containing protein 2 isoform X2 n=1 Tax=Schistocerca piceifrons TaxID=274613 RepID=UPI001F5E8CFC|nr:ankyrin repeat and LEM domain-containing protein 2 isoform X2 [Schistocerca piceifrons]XP_049939185.1 ankyrin repeat and LEM domain-containing protein 2 isoform X2 [Schistocerca serialis cubense]